MTIQGVPDPPIKFVGRAEELEVLASTLLGEQGTGKVFAYGPPGVGKTALVTEFTYSHLTAFPGGVHHFPSAAMLDQPEEAIRTAEITADHFEPESDALIVVEEVTSSDPIGVAAFVGTLQNRRPGTKFIFTSRLQLLLPPDWVTVQLEGLPPDDLTILLSDQGVAEAELGMLLAHCQGNPLLAMTIANLARQGEGVEQLLSRLGPTSYPGLLGPDGRPLDPHSRSLESVGRGVRAVSEDLMARVKQDPDQVHSLTSRQFEEFVAALYEKHGFEVELTPATGDGGVDLYAVRYMPFGKMLTVVECKRNAPHRRVGVELVRSLHGALEDKGASIGVLATTSSFTSGAKAYQDRHAFRLRLQDWFALQDMMSAKPGDYR
ncbi:MAG TPA: restriction endonuclease [Solirubrobacterales bacterium]|nr:restriction endonuclease [Solirubrobacterales bacterium]